MKTAYQKLFEKYLMLTRNDVSKLTVMLGRQHEDKSKIGMFICHDTTPLAMLMPSEELSKWFADETSTVRIAEVFRFMELEISGDCPEDFEEDVQYPAFSNEAIDNLHLDD